MMKFYKIPGLIKKMFPKAIWDVSVNSGEKKIYLTFDDGPVPEVTEYVLDELEKHRAKATFFCVGANINKHPEIFEKIRLAGHSVGNHTYTHRSGWTVSNRIYYENIAHCQLLTNTDLFRPPYGRLRFLQYLNLVRRYRVVMWDVLTYDFDRHLDQNKALSRVFKLVKSGSVVVFHDSKRAEHNIKYMLPRFLEHFGQLGFQFESL